MPYTAHTTRQHDRDELIRRIPGWGADIDPLDRPSVPQERRDVAPDVPWDLPTPQQSTGFRERSIEHAMLPPVYGTVAPLKGASGAIRRLAYARFSEARAAHWLLLLGADRVDVIEDRLSSIARLRAVPVLPTGRNTGAIAGRRLHREKGRVDRSHSWLDPIVSNGWALVATAVAASALRHRRRSGL